MMSRLTTFPGIVANILSSRTCALLVVALLLGACTAARPPTVLTELSSSARTPDEHRAVAAAYREYSERLRMDAAKYAELAESWSNKDAGWDDEETRHARLSRAIRDQEVAYFRALADSLSREAAAAAAIAAAHEESAGSPSPVGQASPR
jgi:hypothetical protein